MVQGNARAADFLHQRFALHLELLQIGRPKRWVGRAGEDKVGHFQIAHWAVVRRRQGIDLLRDPQRRLTGFVRWSHVTDNRWENAIAEDHQRVVAQLAAIRFTKARWNHDVRIRRAD